MLRRYSGVFIVGMAVSAAACFGFRMDMAMVLLVRCAGVFMVMFARFMLVRMVMLVRCMAAACLPMSSTVFLFVKSLVLVLSRFTVSFSI